MVKIEDIIDSYSKESIEEIFLNGDAISFNLWPDINGRFQLKDVTIDTFGITKYDGDLSSEFVLYVRTKFIMKAKVMNQHNKYLRNLKDELVFEGRYYLLNQGNRYVETYPNEGNCFKNLCFPEDSKIFNNPYLIDFEINKFPDNKILK